MKLLSKADISDLLKKLCDYIVINLKPKKIILFGSFARGDAVNRSDVDLAIEIENTISDGEWLNFLHRISEKKFTLRKMDILRLDKTSPEMLQAIKKEGIILYESIK